MAFHPSDPDTTLATLSNGVRVLTLQMPQVDSASVSVFVRTGSAHESRRLNGASHFCEHMAFKGTAERSCQQVNLDAELLGAEVNAHTDKDHTAYHMRGMARDAGQFVRMLGDIVRHSSYPQAELERERQVILHEYTEDEDDGMSTAFKLFDKLCFGTHALAQPVIGTRGNIERLTRDELTGYVRQQYTGANVIVGVAGNVDPADVLAHAQAAFGTMEAGAPNVVTAPDYLGGVAARKLPGAPQTHVVLGFALPPLTGEHHAGVVAAALFGEGMSSPLMDQVRERRALVYYAACSADVMELGGQFVIEASTAPEQLDEFIGETMRLLLAHTASVSPVDLERARNQIAVRHLRAQEQPYQRLEDAARDLFALGRVRPRGELLARVQAVTADEVRAEFRRMMAAPASVAVTGKVAQGVSERVRALVTPARRQVLAA
jgi:predicted Zn-dependent peptidase